MERVSDGNLRWAIRRLNEDIARYENSTFLAQYGMDTLRLFEQIAHEVLACRAQRCETCDWEDDDGTCVLWWNKRKPHNVLGCTGWEAKEADDAEVADDLSGPV